MEQAETARSTVSALREAGRMGRPEAEALAVLLVGLAEVVDADVDGNAALWRELRQAWRELREVTEDDGEDPIAALIADLTSAGPAGGADVRDATPAGTGD
ncbi:MAG: hypothetical protein GY925_13195 [Actinomycetia bacterium]|nr:hypothetical protein [Actinomycetes bacterium]